MTRLEDISGEITSPKSCAGGGLPEHWTAVEARKKREIVIRRDERYKVLDEVNAILARDPAVAKHSLQQIEIIRLRVNELRQSKDGEP